MKVSECCGAPMGDYLDVMICPECKEHCGVETETGKYFLVRACSLYIACERDEHGRARALRNDVLVGDSKSIIVAKLRDIADELERNDVEMFEGVNHGI